MKSKWLVTAVLLLSTTLLLAAADGSWLKKVSPADRKRVNPYAGQSEAAAAGRNLFADNCARCHGENATGRYNRPSLRSARIAHATDGELAWILKNGEPWKGMPSWSSLPEQQRWQIITYLRKLQAEPISESADATR
ncbi:MAG TPA: c-type cytochrome [Acidisarcina sp.]|nr:c-type cytochrome [Acidisarcina sp.]